MESWSSSSTSLANHGLGGGTGRSKRGGASTGNLAKPSGAWVVCMSSGLLVSVCSVPTCTGRYMTYVGSRGCDSSAILRKDP